MPKYQVTLIFDLPGHGFSESWWRDTSQTNLDAVRDDAVRLAEQRMKLAAPQCLLQGIRVSNADSAGRVGKTYYEPMAGTASGTAAASNVALNCQFGDADNQNQKLVQVRGFPDDWELSGGAAQKTNDALQSAFASWRAALIQGQWGWRGVLSRTEYAVVGYTVAPDNVVTVDLLGDIGPLGGVTNKKSVRFSGVNDKSALNGVQVIRPKPPGQVELVKPLALGPFKSPGKMTVYAYTVHRVQNGTVQRIGNRQAGSPLLRSVGRRSARPRV